MNYLQALADVYREGGLPRGVTFRPDLLQQMLQDRQSMIKDGFRLWIEPQSPPVETVQELEGGKRCIRYSATVLYAFEKKWTVPS